MKTRNHMALLVGVALLACAGSETASAHGLAGKRFFPATLATDDPFVADELALPTLFRRTSSDSDGAKTVESSASVDFSKRLTTNFGIGFGASYLTQKPDGGDTIKGFDNFSANVKYQFYKSEEHETILSAGVDWDIGGTGTRRIGRESFSTFTPAVFFGKGMGDLPDSMMFLRPLAFTGNVGIAIPSRASTTTFNDDGDADIERHPHVGKLGFAVEYSLPYLQSFVRDVGLGEPFNHMIPLIEVSLQKPLDRGRGPLTGAFYPGVLIPGRYMQFGLEAVIPVNGREGRKVGVLAQLHFFLDDLAPKTFGKPLFGN